MLYRLLHNHTTRFGFFEQCSAEPRLEQPVVGCTLVLAGSNHLSAALASDDVGSLEFPAPDFVIDQLASWCASILSLHLFVYAALVNIYQTVFRYFRHFPQKLRSFTFAHRISSFFLRVFLCFFNDNRIASWLHLNANAISSIYSSGCAATYSRNFSGSIITVVKVGRGFPDVPLTNRTMRVCGASRMPRPTKNYRYFDLNLILQL